MSRILEGNHVVITGGDGALGASVVQTFLEAGAICHLPVLHGSAANPLAGTQVTPNVDLSDQHAVSAYYAGLPSLAASVHLAGGFASKPIAETTRVDLEQQLTLNLLTAFLCCREAVKVLRKSGGGRIVNVAARVIEQPLPQMVAYTISKAGVAALTRSLAVEVRGDGILVNAVLPSIIDTPANRAAMPDAKTDRWPKPDQLARTILWLASPENQLTSGALIPVYGNA
jgi:NAD(P)-dependent dehydrogenase (short-subunit alcohol dehydrogenase family)